MENKTEQTVEAWPELVSFADAMRARLGEKAPERGRSWKQANPEHLLQTLNDHVFHLEDAIFEAGGNDRIRKKAVDVANLAMMIFDVATAAAEAQPPAARPSAVRTCRVCGCTDDRACEGGCWWVEDPKGGDLCSRCAEASHG